VLEELGAKPDREFNVLNGKTRLLYRGGSTKVDVFIDEFQMCHFLRLAQRVGYAPVTLPPADLCSQNLTCPAKVVRIHLAPPMSLSLAYSVVTNLLVYFGPLLVARNFSRCQLSRSFAGRCRTTEIPSCHLFYLRYYRSR
jgi:hypothetical protein